MEDLHESKSCRLIHIMKAPAWKKRCSDTTNETGITPKEIQLIKYIAHEITEATAKPTASGCQGPNSEDQAVSGNTTNMWNTRIMLIGSKWSVLSAWQKGVTALG